jgi:hypothetical protein
MNSISVQAHRLALFILSPEGQSILVRHVFNAPALPTEEAKP